MRVIYNLCKEWEKNPSVEIITFSNSLINSFARARPLTYLKNQMIYARSRSCTYDVLNIHGVSFVNLRLGRICKCRGIPIVYTAHGAAVKEKEMGYPYSKDFIKLEKYLLLMSDKIIAVSPVLKELIIERYRLPDEKITVVYNGINPFFGDNNSGKINIRKKYGIPQNKKIILNVGGTRKVKDISFLISSLELLDNNMWHLVLVGRKGDQHRTIIKQCNSKLKNNYIFTNIIPEKDLYSFYHEAHVYVSTSIYEPFGLTPLESIKFGTTALVRSTIGGSQQYFYHDPLLFKKYIFNTTKELAELITKYINNDKKMDNRLINKIISYNSWNNRAKEYLKLFNQITHKQY